MKLKILLLGKNGQVGWELRQKLLTLGELVALGRNELDLTNVHLIRQFVREIKPNLIVNAAAYTDVDRAESEPELAMDVNGTAPGVLAEEAAQIGAGLVHFSSDYVFDGTKHEPYKEQDEPNPLNVYGKTKLAGERMIIKVGGAFLILRTSWVYSLRKDCFVTNMLRWASEQRVIRVVDDQVSSPTWCRTVAKVTSHILANAGTDLLTCLEENSGLYHLASLGQVSRYQWAEAILDEAPTFEAQSAKQLLPAKSSDFPGLAKRPTFSCLDSSALVHRFGCELPHWRLDLNSAFKS